MNFFSGLFRKKEKQIAGLPFAVDMHSHLLPNIDDGSDSLDSSVEMIKALKALGYRKLITTPHIMGDFFKNSPATILPKLELVRSRIKQEGIDIEIEAAAEYYLDEWFMDKVKADNIMTFGGKYILFETSYINEPSNLYETIFELKARGYKPVLAHPERYTYLYSSFERLQEIYDKGVFFQLNLNSLSGYYSKGARSFAIKMIEEEMVDFVGTDCHGIRHIEALHKTISNSAFQKLHKLNLKNNSLL